MFKNMEIDEFTTKLGSEAPVPGGGGAAALGASLGAALTAMVFNLTVGKKVFQGYDEETKAYIVKKLEEVNSLKEDFLTYIDKDAEAFSKIIEAYKLPKATEEEKKYRSSCISEGSKFAAMVPMELLKKADGLYELIEAATRYGNKNVISDAGAAAIFNHCVIEIAALNIAVNLSGIKDEALKTELELIPKKMLKDSEARKNELLKKVYGIIENN